MVAFLLCSRINNPITKPLKFLISVLIDVQISQLIKIIKLPLGLTLAAV